MSSSISPTLPAGPAAVTTGARGRAADEPQGRSFGAVLDRSRAAGAPKGEDEAQALPLATTPRHRRAPAGEGEDAHGLELQVMAWLGSVTPNARLASAAGTASLPPPRAVGVAAMPPGADAIQAAPPDNAETGAAQGASNAIDASDAAPAHAQEGAPKHTPQAALPAAPPANPGSAATTLPAAAAAVSSSPATVAGSAAAAQAAPAEGAAPSPAPMEKAASSLPAADDVQFAAAAAGLERPDAPAAANAPPASFTAPMAQVQPAAIDRPAAAPPAAHAPVLTVAPAVGSDEWGPAIGQQMLRMSTSGQHVAELNLNPAGLGPLKVTLTLGDQQAQAMFVSAHESVRRAVEAALPQLRTTLAEQGISLGQASVGAESRQPPSQDGGFAQQQSGSSRSPTPPARGNAERAAIAEPLRAPRRTSAGVDTFA
ncbi:MAG: flagellar hook-length control protein FliK [Variovorax sp.]|nr:MAG: flagellar hook-length control protein FliK [Variovorax sp.]